MKKEKIVKGPRKPPKRALQPINVNMKICGDCVGDFDQWMECNIVALSQAFAAIVFEMMQRGQSIVSLNTFEEFCRDTHAQTLEAVTQVTATRH